MHGDGVLVSAEPALVQVLVCGATRRVGILCPGCCKVGRWLILGGWVECLWVQLRLLIARVDHGVLNSGAAV